MPCPLHLCSLPAAVGTCCWPVLLVGDASMCRARPCSSHTRSICPQPRLSHHHFRRRLLPQQPAECISQLITLCLTADPQAGIIGITATAGAKNISHTFSLAFTLAILTNLAQFMAHKAAAKRCVGGAVQCLGSALNSGAFPEAWDSAQHVLQYAT